MRRTTSSRDEASTSPTMISPACVNGSINGTVALDRLPGCGYVDDSLEKPPSASRSWSSGCFLNVPVPSIGRVPIDDDDRKR